MTKLIDTRLNADSPIMTSNLDFAEARWAALSAFGLSKPSGDLKRDLEENKKVLIQRGISVREATPAKDLGENIVQFIASTDGVKRDGNMVMNDGWIFDSFRKNPVFLWCHDYRSLPIGKHVQWRVDREGDKSLLRIWVQFAGEDVYPFADRVRKLYEAGFMRAVSIGWTPLEYERLLDDDGDQVGWKFTKNDLLEVSAVPVPSDPDAIIEAFNQRILQEGDEALMSQWMDLPRVSRGIAYTISHLDPIRSESESTEETNEEVKETSEETTRSPDEAGSEEKSASTEVQPEEVVEEERVTDAEVEDPMMIARAKIDELMRSFSSGLLDIISTLAGPRAAEAPVETVQETKPEEVIEIGEVITPERSAEDDIEPVTRIGSRLSKATKEKLDKCRGCMDEAIKYLSEAYGEDDDEDDEDDEEEKEDVADIPADPQLQSVEVAKVRTEEVTESEDRSKEILDVLGDLSRLFGASKEEEKISGEPPINEEELLESLNAMRSMFSKPKEEPKVEEEPQSEYVSKLFESLGLLRSQFKK